MATTAFFTGFKFPFSGNETSLPAAATDNDLIKQSLIQIVLTQKGERVMRPDFGSRAMSFVFENNNETLAEAVRTDITSAVAKFEPRVILRKVQVTREDNSVTVDLQYVVLATRQDQRLKVAIPTSTPA